MEEDTQPKMEKSSFIPILFNQIANVTEAFSMVRAYGYATEFRRNVQFLEDSIDATETLLISYLDDEYWTKKKKIMNKPVRDFDDIYAERLKGMNRFDFNTQDEIEDNRELYRLRRILEKLRLIFRELMKWAGKHKLLFNPETGQEST